MQPDQQQLKSPFRLHVHRPDVPSEQDGDWRSIAALGRSPSFASDFVQASGTATRSGAFGQEIPVADPCFSTLFQEFAQGWTILG